MVFPKASTTIMTGEKACFHISWILLLVFLLSCKHSETPEAVSPVVDYRHKWTGEYSGMAYGFERMPFNPYGYNVSDSVSVLVKVEIAPLNPYMLFHLLFSDTPKTGVFNIPMLPIGEDGGNTGRQPIYYVRFMGVDSLICGSYEKHGPSFYESDVIYAKRIIRP
jgi:hypothetical protein